MPSLTLFEFNQTDWLAQMFVEKLDDFFGDLLAIWADALQPMPCAAFLTTSSSGNGNAQQVEIVDYH